jgi:hypothetical protein
LKTRDQNKEYLPFVQVRGVGTGGKLSNTAQILSAIL